MPQAGETAGTMPPVGVATHQKVRPRETTLQIVSTRQRKTISQATGSARTIQTETLTTKKTSTSCDTPSVLSENGFQDCEESLRFLESEEGKQAIINLHIDGIYRYLSRL